MTTVQFLSHVHDLGINLWADGDDLRYIAPEGALTQELRAELVERKTDILAFLRETQAVALPKPDKANLKVDDVYVAPRTPTEETLARIWAEVLDVEQVGIRDNFFELGGDSLGVTRVVSRMHDTFWVKLSPHSLFESQTVAELSERLEEARCSIESREQLRPVVRDDDPPLSFAQERMWFLEQFDPGSSLYNISTAYRLSGDLNVAALEKGLNEIVRRHDSLRTTFRVKEGQPVQIIAPTLALSVPVVDLRDCPRAERGIEVQRLAAKEAHKPFDLTRGPLLRATVLRLDEEEHVLLLIIHHIVSDGWSMGIFNRELAVLYEAFSTGKPSSLTDLSIQYADFAVWQRQWLQDEVLESQLAYWRERLDGAPPLLELPTDRPRPAVQTSRGAAQSMLLSDSLSESLRVLGRKQNCTLFMTLLAAFKTLLYRYTGQEDIVVGTPIANRNRSEIEKLIGFFVNTLALRTSLSRNPTFQELLERVRETALDAYVHQDLPFEKLVEELKPERDTSRAPLIQTMFVFQNAPGDTLDLPGVTMSRFRLDGGTISEFDLILEMIDSRQGLEAAFEYNTDLFDATTVSRMVSHFHTLLEGIVANPGQRLSELPLLTEAERRQWLVEWNDTQADYPRDRCIHALFEAQALQTPNVIAVVCNGEQLTYDELNRRANQLAHHLRKLGVAPEALVGLCVERSIEMIVGILGILKAGGAYVPLNPAYPKERLTFMLEDIESPVLLTQRRLAKRLPMHDGTRIFYLDTGWEDIDPQCIENSTSEVAAGNLAYVLFTSGSTGRPKGVKVEHSSVLALLHAYEQTAPSGDKLVGTSVCPFGFDVSVWEFFSTLCFGGTLHILPPEVFADPRHLADYLVDSRVTSAYIPPGLLPGVASELETHSGPLALDRILVGVEPIQQSVLQRFRNLFPQMHIVNGYGPTESTICATFYGFQSATDLDRRTPIGTPVPGYQVYLVDRCLQPVPIGVPGEILVGGPGLGRGYLHRPDLTAERFIPNLFSSKPGARLYKTGDLARFLPDGNIEFLGRTDRQVKIRGFRIEVGEIEAALRQHPAVRNTVVLAQGNQPDDKRLVAYVVPDQESALTISELRSFLKDKLPEYMVPAIFLMLDVLPLTPNGKVDRCALPSPEGIRPELEKAFVASRTPTEKVLTGIWSHVLGIGQVGIYDNFFDLGGHSLLAIQVVSRVRDAFQIELPLLRLFETSTVAELAQSVDEILQTASSATIVAITSREDFEEIEL